MYELAAWVEQSGLRMPTEEPRLRRLRLPLDNHASDLLLVGDRFEEGGRYVQMEVPRGESEGWSWLDWDERYDLLAEEWRRLHEARETIDRAMHRPLL